MYLFFHLVVYICVSNKVGSNVTNLDGYESTGAHWIVRYLNGDNESFSHNFEVKYIPKLFKKFKGKTNIVIASIYRKETYHSVIFGYFYIAFIDYMLER